MPKPASYAFPIPQSTCESAPGLTKRELFAAMAMQSILAVWENEDATIRSKVNSLGIVSDDRVRDEALERSSGNIQMHGYGLLAELSVQMADALVAELETEEDAKDKA